MLSRTLPPIIFPRPPSPPIATFVHIPRRYGKAMMQSGNQGPDTKMEDASPESPSQRRKSTRLHDTRISSISSSAGHSSDYQGPTSAPASPRSTRKRATSTLDTNVNGSMPGNGDSPADMKGPPSADSTSSGEMSGRVCLCQPEPKIPRPRNAFILYRQHHQHAIVARNPGLPNPDISKIIGEQWKAESQDQKLVWQTLAQEEKMKHQEQYPDYRYQPRRSGKGSLSQTQHTTFDMYRCSRCGGRNLKVPASPYSTTPTPTLPPITAPDSASPTTRYLPPMSNLSLESPAYRRVVRPGPSGLSNIQVPQSPGPGDSPMYSPGTPGTKRRRYNYPPESNGRRGEPPYYGQVAARRESVPHNQLRPSSPNTATMLPPPPRTPREARRASVDLNVLVPEQHDQSRSVEAMVMSVPYHIKIKVLGRITPPLKDPGPTSPSISIRGAIIAIEGDDTDAVKELAEWLNDFLVKTDEYKPRIAEAPRLPKHDKKVVTFGDCLDLIKEWHVKSKEMIKYITTPVSSSSASSSDSDSDMDSDSKPSKSKSKDKEKEREVGSSQDSVSTKKPVIILPTYQLHSSNVYTSRIPIADAYSPTDHWQWMATLWRGTVGPDLTIYIRSPDTAGAGESKEGAANGNKLVELIDDYRLLTVRKEKAGKFDAAALRRVGFEVGEWIQNVSSKASSA